MRPSLGETTDPGTHFGMELRRFSGVLRGHWIFIVCSVVVCILGAAGLLHVTKSVYSTHTQLFVSDNSGAGDPAATYQGGLFSQQRVLSYSQIMSSPAVLDAVIKRLHLNETAQQLAANIQTGVPPNTVLLDVTVQDHSALRALTIARALDEEFIRLVGRLESPAGGGRSAVKVTVTDPAQLPTSISSPRKAEYLAIGLVLGLVIGVGGAFVLEAFDRRIRSEGDAVQAARAPVLGRVVEGRTARARTPVAANNPSSAAAEAYSRLRVNLGALVDDNDLRSIAIASVKSDDGHAIVAANVAILFSRAGYRTILVEGDLRSPRLAAMFGVPPRPGLAEVVKNEVALELALQTWSLGARLQVMAGGSEVPSSSELLGSPRFQGVLQELFGRADVVIFSAPPLLGATDGAILARVTSGTVILARKGSTAYDDLAAAAESVRAVNAPVLGVVLNGRVRQEGAGKFAEDRAQGQERTSDASEAAGALGAVGHSADL